MTKKINFWRILFLLVLVISSSFLEAAWAQSSAPDGTNEILKELAVLRAKTDSIESEISRLYTITLALFGALAALLAGLLYLTLDISRNLRIPKEERVARLEQLTERIKDYLTQISDKMHLPRPILGLLLALTLLFASSVWATIPQTINFQGRLSDANGPITGQQSVTFTAYDAETGETKLGSETAKITPDSNGIFNYALGSQQSLNLTQTIDFTKPVWIEIKVGEQTLSPRQPLRSAPFALGNVSKAGDTIKGDVKVEGKLTATKFIGDGTGLTGMAFEDYVKKSGDSMNGPLTVKGDVKVEGELNATKFIGDGSGLTNMAFGDYVKKSGDSMSGTLTAKITDLSGNIATGEVGTYLAPFFPMAVGVSGKGPIGGFFESPVESLAVYAKGGFTSHGNSTITGNLTVFPHGSPPEFTADFTTYSQGKKTLDQLKSKYPEWAAKFPSKVQATSGAPTPPQPIWFASKIQDLENAINSVDKKADTANTAITNIQLTPGPVGAAGAIGPQGPAGVNGLSVSALKYDPTNGLQWQLSGQTTWSNVTNGNQLLSTANTTYFDQSGNIKSNRITGTLALERIPVLDQDRVPASYTRNLATSGNLTIGTATAGTKIAVSGLAQNSTLTNTLVYDPVTGGIYFQPSTSRTSSRRYKNNISLLSDDFNKILLAEPKAFTWKNDGKADIGFIAEEFDALGLKDLVIYNQEGQPDAIKYDKVPLYLLEVVKGQQKAIDSLKAELEELKAKLGK